MKRHSLGRRVVGYRLIVLREGDYPMQLFKDLGVELDHVGDVASS